jgi:hypothetical protein
MSDGGWAGIAAVGGAGICKLAEDVLAAVRFAWSILPLRLARSLVDKAAAFGTFSADVTYGYQHRGYTMHSSGVLRDITRYERELDI